MTEKNTSALTAISPIDGRYASKTKDLRDIFSEFGLIKYRILVELRYLCALSQCQEIKEISPFDKNTNAYLESIITHFSLIEGVHVKTIERTVNHDVKAIEYFLIEKLQKHKILRNSTHFLHFGLTSEDVNSLSYALMLTEARRLLVKKMEEVLSEILNLVVATKNTPMLSKTHGQSASPTTMSKELANVAHRLLRQIRTFKRTEILAKFSGAVGNFNAHYIAYAKVDWHSFAKNFVESLGVSYLRFATQIEPHDYIAEYFQTLGRFNTILIDFSRDIWAYISIGHFKQKMRMGEVGSSTMPHKINPIDFENAEGNLGLANALGNYFAAKLPISRWQRDLSDSTVLRNLGVCCAHSIIAYDSLLQGISKLMLDEKNLMRELDNHLEVLAEAVQTVMRRYHIAHPYEKLKALTRGEKINTKLLENFIKNLDIPEAAKKELLNLTPAKYIGDAKNFDIKVLKP